MELLSLYSNSPNSCDILAEFLTKHFFTPPIILCLGTDKMLADCLGAVVGTNLRNSDYPNYVYGGMLAPITHQNAQFCHDFIHTMHPFSPLIIIDSMATITQSRLAHISVRDDYIGAVNSLNLHADLFIYGISAILKNDHLHSAKLCNILSLNNTIIVGIKKFLKNTQKIGKNSFIPNISHFSSSKY